MGCRVFKNNACKITFKYKGKDHTGIDLVGPNSTFDYIVAHSAGTVVAIVSNCNKNTSKTGERIYGNYVKLKHDNGMYTLYAHMKYGSVKVKKGDKVSKGQVLGYMGNTGYSFGAHVHFEVRNEKDKYIDPTKYVDADLPKEETTTSSSALAHKVGEKVTINGVYASSTSTMRLTPAVTTGEITKIVEGARNPYLLNNGGLGWVNDDCIVSAANKTTNSSIKVGDKVKVKKGAKSYKRSSLASFVYNTVYDVIEIKGDRAVIGKGKSVTTDIHVNNLYK